MYPLLILIASKWNKKAYLWIEGRKQTWQLLQSFTSNNTKPTVWVHCSSLGEFEQGRPIIEAIKNTYPNYAIVVSFFSPSGYEPQKYYAIADCVVYLPMDSSNNAAKWLQLVKPKLIVFIKYDFWYYYISDAAKAQIPIVLASAIFRKNQIFFNWYGNFYRQLLRYFSFVFVQDEASQQLLATIQINNQVFVFGDTRFDRVFAIAAQEKTLPIIEQFVAAKPTIIAGSTWLNDDKLLQAFITNHTNVQLLVAPHHVNEEHITAVKKIYKKSVLYTDVEAKKANINQQPILIVNTVGLLSSLYKYGALCYIGGGFTKDGIHNIAEAAVYNKPIVFGSTYHKYKEAVDIIALQGAVSINNYNELAAAFNLLLLNPAHNKKTGQIAGEYCKQHSGATEKIMRFIYENRLLTNA